MLATPNAILVEHAASAPATLEALDMLHETLDRFWHTADHVLDQLPDPLWRLMFATAVAEIGANIVRHAYPERASEGTICLRLRLYQGHVEACFIDKGVRYTPPQDALLSVDEIANAIDIPDLAESGYGLAIARTALDRVQYRRTRGGVNCWRLVKAWNMQLEPPAKF